ncbi:hypothetical protein BC936DRAFT_142428 [Jimgerdemannia flammicorona]|uniref:Uncharacterized protein n=1 Tax=Jimgerdemannia flammicorona TaxID=994334 RepID=A0A433DFA9_9FUNG|nr:hypothetical protein BC936DRAFT_142428 [Jimgerdemannia flammicorona]
MRGGLLGEDGPARNVQHCELRVSNVKVRNEIQGLLHKPPKSIGEIPIGEISIGEIPNGEIPVGEIPIGEIPFAENAPYGHP